MNEKVDILLVDDEPRNLDALEAILDDPGYELLRATSADAALRLLLTHDVAAIVLDIKMPGTSGFELAKMIKSSRRHRQIPILFLTAYLVEDKDIVAGYGAGAVDYLTKPLNPAIVQHKIAVFAELFRKSRALAELNEKLEERVQERTADLERSEAALRAADRKKDEFIAILAHELRNPLAPLRFGLDILSNRQAELSPQTTKILATMNRQLGHMVRLIDDLLDMSRISSGSIELKRAPEDLANIIQTAVEINRPFLEGRHHQVTLDVDRKLSANCDATRVAQIIGNLLHNAAKFTPDGGQIRVELVESGADALIRVTDSGEGIPPDQIEHAFDMFARINRAGAPSSTTTPTAERGLGIGLALGRRLAEIHDGSLTATSAGSGHGTAFTLRLPLWQAQVQPARDVVPLPAPPSGLDIVVIEDSADVGDTLVEWLEGVGHKVALARSGLAGIELVKEHVPDLVLCDLGLPGIDGLEVCRRLRGLQLPRQPLIAAITGWGRESDRQRTTAAGFDAHLVKPVAVDALEALLRRAAHV
jgi:signal transduction histidine kinase